MDKRMIVSQWQAALQKMFPGVIVGWNRGIPDEPDAPMLDVFMIPDAHAADFCRFFIYDAPKIIEAENLPDMDLLPHTVSATREHYPEVWRRAQSEFSAVAKTAPRKARPKIRGAASGKAEKKAASVRS